ncbi:MAG: 6-phosphogluconolactonase [Pseudomonadota bacterium]
MNLQEYPDRTALFSGLATTVFDQLNTALGNGPATLAVPGGTTPQPFFEQLRTMPLDWARVRVMLTDERFVPETSDRSNTRLLRETLLQDAAAASQYVPFYEPAPAPEDVLHLLTDRIQAALPLTVCVLGMGADMHTASLFPGADQLTQALSADAPPLLPMRAPGAAEPRLTLTLPVLQGAAHTHILITGAEKRAALDRAISETDTKDAPVRGVLSQATVHWAE